MTNATVLLLFPAQEECCLLSTWGLRLYGAPSEFPYFEICVYHSLNVVTLMETNYTPKSQ